MDLNRSEDLRRDGFRLKSPFYYKKPALENKIYVDSAHLPLDQKKFEDSLIEDNLALKIDP
jgi:hypothetical protein